MVRLILFLSCTQDKILNKLAIGRFLWDMMVDLCTAMGHSSAAALSRTGPSTQVQERTAAANKSMLIYSGHDSTLVPVLCALGLYDGEKVYCSYLLFFIFYAFQCLFGALCGTNSSILCLWREMYNH